MALSESGVFQQAQTLHANLLQIVKELSHTIDYLEKATKTSIKKCTDGHNQNLQLLAQILHDIFGAGENQDDFYQNFTKLAEFLEVSDLYQIQLRVFDQTAIQNSLSDQIKEISSQVEQMGNLMKAGKLPKEPVSISSAANRGSTKSQMNVKIPRRAADGHVKAMLALQKRELLLCATTTKTL